MTFSPMETQLQVPADPGAGAGAGAGDTLPDGYSITVPLVEETMRVEKKTIDRGGYRVVKQVSTHDATWDELLRNQQVEIERRPINAWLEATDMPQQRYEGGVLIFPVVKEVLVKRLLLVEEVRVTSIESTHRDPQQVTLRKEEISIERLEPDDPSDLKPL